MNTYYEAYRDNDADAHVIQACTDCPPHFHSSFELYYVDAGEIHAIINDKGLTMKKGELSVALNCDIHSYRPEIGGKSLALLIPPSLTKEFLNVIGKKSIQWPFIQNPEAAEEISYCMRQIMKNAGNRFTIKGYVNIIFGKLLENLVFVDTKILGDDKNLPIKILNYLNENYMEDLSLKMVSSALGYNSFYISKFFNSYFNCSLTDYVNMLRLRQFINIQLKSDESITTNALACGFGCIRTFNRAFKKEFGMTPKEYLEINRIQL